MKRSTLHYIAGCLALTVYGGQVCPFLDSLSILQLLINLGIAYLIQYLIRVQLNKKIVEQAEYKRQSRVMFQMELALFIISAFVLTIFDTLYYGFPIGSGLKLVLANTMLGFFAAIDLSLEKEWKLSQFFAQSGQTMDLDDHYFSQPKKLTVFSTSMVLFISGIIFLIVNKDIDWIRQIGQDVSLARAQFLILMELGFVAGIILLHLFNIIKSYARNLDLFLSKETQTLLKATNGNFDVKVPVASNDEFGIMAKYTNTMILGLKKRTDELQQTQDVTIRALASLAETRDNETGNHILRTQRYMRELAEYLKLQDDFSDFLNDTTIELLYKSAPLHDIGKVGIPDRILLKPGKLTDEEFKIMKTHAELGSRALRVAEKELGKNSFLKFAREIALSHHEKWDGSGYPNQLKGEKIPLSGRLMAVADVYDALISKRVYKKGFTHERACQIIFDGTGKHFDPKIIETFRKIEPKFREIASHFTDK
jgi:HD-GYP domain-containing protein (c-di-GMP phosphodiesterase class II)